MPEPIGLYFEFAYGTQGGVPLTKEIPLIACRAGRYAQGLRPYDLIAGGVPVLFNQIKSMKHLTFSKANQVRALDFTSTSPRLMRMAGSYILQNYSLDKVRQRLILCTS